MRALRLLTASYRDDPAFDTAVSRALLERVAAGELPDTLRLARPGAMVAFGKQDAVAAAYPVAAAAACEQGFEAVLRLAGGRAAVFHERTVLFALTVAEADPRAEIHVRFRTIAAVVERALRRLGVDARVGEVPGEYCPGDYSVNARGRRKLMGVGQRLVAGGAHVGGVVVVDEAERVRDVLVPVYEALGLDWNPATAGSVAEEAPGVGIHDVLDALRHEVAGAYALEEAELDERTLELASALAPEHRGPAAQAA